MTIAPSKLAVVVPCFRAEAHLERFLDRLIPSLDGLSSPSEVILVDDGSPDDTWGAMETAYEKYGERLRCIRLASNVGQHAALTVGLGAVSPDAEIVITMDDDLQHPPESIPELVSAVEAGADLVIASYDEKQHDGLRNAGGSVIDWTLRSIYRLPKHFQLTSFRAFRKYLADQVASAETHFPYVTAMLLSATTRVRNVPVSHAPRIDGQSGYGVLKSIRLAANLYFTYSKYPLYLVLGLAGFSFLLTLGLGMWVSIGALRGNWTVPGWASLMAVVSFGNSITLACMSIFGVYVSRFHRERSGVSHTQRISKTL